MTDLDTNIIKENEIFSYLGRRYVRKMEKRLKLDEKGDLITKITRTYQGMIPDGWEEGDPEEVFYGVKKKVKDHPNTLKEKGRPLTVENIPIGPIPKKDIFKFEDEPIIYENKSLKDQILVRSGNAIILKPKENISGEKTVSNNSN